MGGRWGGGESKPIQTTVVFVGKPKKTFCKAVWIVGRQRSSGLLQSQWGDSDDISRAMGTQERGRREEAPSGKRPLLFLQGAFFSSLQFVDSKK